MPERSAVERIRPAVVAGRFYPLAADALRREVAGYLRPARAAGGRPKALVVPHAGYMYSGAVAGAAYGEIGPVGDAIRRVVLLGPSHQIAFRGLAVPAVDAFETPLGLVPVDADGRLALREEPSVIVSNRPHEFEHSLEVQLPFLQSVLGSFTLLPMVAGDATAAEVADVLEHVWGGAETLLVISTDLSHYHDDASAKAMDRTTSEHIVALESCLHGEDACGFVGLNGFIVAARRRGMRAREIRRCTSGDVTGDLRRVVGYGAYAFYET